MEVDVHKVMTTLFNVELNEFLARFDKYKTFETVRTGGLMEIKSHEGHLFHTYTLWLNEFREQLYQKSANFRMELEPFQKEMESLLELYVHLKLLVEYHVFSEKAEKDLDEYFLKPFVRFIKKLDETFGSAYFVSRINELVNETVNVTVKVVNAFNIPLSNIKVEVSYVRFIEFGEHAKAYSLCTLRTNDAGIAGIRLLRPREGGYRVDIEKKYNKITFLDVNISNYVEIKVFDFSELVKHGVSKLFKKKKN